MTPIAQYTLFAISLLGTAFAVYRSIHDPDEEADKSISILTLRVDLVEKKLNNDLPKIDAKVDGIQQGMMQTRLALERLSTTVDERLPRKT